MSVVVYPCRRGLRGVVRVPGDKSVSHRAVMLGSVAQGETLIDGFAPGADNRSTIDVFRKMGAEIEVDEESKTVRVFGRGPGGLQSPEGLLDCGNSGTTMRLTAGLLTGLGLSAQLVGDASLSARPMARVVGPLNHLGGRVTALGAGHRPPLKIEKGEFQGGEFTQKIASAQVKSCLLLAGLLSSKPVHILEPAPSRDHTEVLLRYLGVPLTSSDHYQTPGMEGMAQVILPIFKGALKARDLTVPGDISSAAFLIVAGSIVSGSEINLSCCGMGPTRRGILDCLEKAGVRLRLERARRTSGGEQVADIKVEYGMSMPMEIGAQIVPRLIDEIPVLAVLAGRVNGRSHFCGVGELRVKESDRLRKTVELLRSCGCVVEEEEDSFWVEGRPGRPFKAFVYDAQDDHRMAAAALVASLVADGPCEIEGLASLNVSYPDLAVDLKGLEIGAAVEGQ